MMTKPKRQRIKRSMDEVMDWLAKNYPQLDAEIDRSWVWITADLRGEQNREIREDLKDFGFRFAKRGHALPSGDMGTWGHSCQRPIRFSGSKSPKPKNENEGEDEDLDEEIRKTLGL